MEDNQESIKQAKAVLIDKILDKAEDLEDLAKLTGTSDLELLLTELAAQELEKKPLADLTELL